MEDLGWEEIADSYDKIVGKLGHYYHEHVIFPHLTKLWELENFPAPKFLDLGCGQGILTQYLPKKAFYMGLDASPSLIEKAKKERKGLFSVQDVCSPFDLPEKEFSHIHFILSLQNMPHPKIALENAAKHLSKQGKLFIILNHPCFRIPRQTSWGIDLERKIQYRRIDHYLTPLSIPIHMKPSKGAASEVTTSYHFPLSHFVNLLGACKLGVTHMEEWSSDKVSGGSLRKMENRARQEFPLFLLLVAQHL